MLSSFQSAKFTYLFNLFDIGNKGIIRKEDLHALSNRIFRIKELDAKAIKKHPSGKIADTFYGKLFRDIGVEGEEGLKLSSWLEFFEKRIVSREDEDRLSEYVRLFLMFIFGFFDENQDGYISLEEYQDLLNLLGAGGNRSIYIHDSLDYNRDQKLSRYEIIMAMETFLTSDDSAELGNWIFGDFES